MSNSPIYGDNDRTVHGPDSNRWVAEFASDSEFGSLFGNIGHFLGNAAKVAGKEIGHVGSSIQKAGGAIDKAIQHVPVVGAPLHTVMSAAYHAVAMPVNMVVDTAIKHRRLDHVLMGELKTQLQDVKAMAPYAQTIVGMVPGIGTGAAAAIGAGLALAEGQPIDKALLEAVTSAVPGGPIAHAAAKTAAAGIEAAAHGQKFDLHAVGPMLSALPIPPIAQESLANGLQLTADIASGKRVDTALADTALKNGLKYLPPEAQKAFHTGIAAQVGSIAQTVKAAHLPDVHNKLIESGIQLSKTLPVVSEARKLSGAGVRGFDLGHGLLSQKASLFDVMHTRAHLTNEAEKKAFDMALANRIGLVAHPRHANMPPAAQAGLTITHGIRGMASQENKTSIMSTLQAHPSASVGAKIAVRHIEIQKLPWPERLVRALRGMFHHVPA